MALGFISYNVDNDRAFRKSVEDAAKKTGDLRVPLTLISKDFYKSEKAIFMLKGRGQYPDIKPQTKAQKRREVGFVYPILKRTGKLARSLTNPVDSYAVNYFEGRTALVIGSEVDYLKFHQTGTVHMPMRKALFIGPEAKKFASDEQVGRLDRWTNILDAYIKEKVRKSGAAS